MNIESLARPEILAMSPYQSARNSAGDDGILLNANEAPCTLVQNPQWDRLRLNRYPVPQPAELTDRMTKLYSVDRDELLVTRGSDEGIDLLLRVFCRPGVDSIVECPPCFGMYRVAANIQGADIIEVPRDPENGLQINFGLLCQTIAANKSIRLVFLTSPNNPTGDIIDQADLQRVLRACSGRALVVLDEAYIEFCASPSSTGLLNQWPNLVVLRTLSKAWGAAGLRCGTVIANPNVIELLQRVMAPYPLSAPATAAALAVTGDEVRAGQREMLEGIAAAKAVLLDELRGHQWVEQVWPGEANFVLLRADDANELVGFCAARGIRIRDFSSQPMLERCVRLTIGSDEEMAVLRTVLNEYGERA